MRQYLSLLSSAVIILHVLPCFSQRSGSQQKPTIQELIGSALHTINFAKSVKQHIALRANALDMAIQMIQQAQLTLLFEAKLKQPNFTNRKQLNFQTYISNREEIKNYLLFLCFKNLAILHETFEDLDPVASEYYKKEYSKQIDSINKHFLKWKTSAKAQQFNKNKQLWDEAFVTNLREIVVQLNIINKKSKETYIAVIEKLPKKNYYEKEALKNSLKSKVTVFTTSIDNFIAKLSSGITPEDEDKRSDLLKTAPAVTRTTLFPVIPTHKPGAQNK